jgi:hypothetical protein
MEITIHAQLVIEYFQSIVSISGTRGQQQDHVASVVTIHIQESIEEESKTNTSFHKTHFEEEHSTYIYII